MQTGSVSGRYESGPRFKRTERYAHHSVGVLNPVARACRPTGCRCGIPTVVRNRTAGRLAGAARRSPSVRNPARALCEDLPPPTPSRRLGPCDRSARRARAHQKHNMILATGHSDGADLRLVRAAREMSVKKSSCHAESVAGLTATSIRTADRAHRRACSRRPNRASHGNPPLQHRKTGVARTLISTIWPDINAARKGSDGLPSACSRRLFRDGSARWVDYSTRW